ncbi:hypothetical protein [Exiguobacterium artemiae]|uniref:hypothetical protein n=1 Tax=Exiguobacterium artemiae TaxID=340145 RepID=UPI003D00C41D
MEYFKDKIFPEVFKSSLNFLSGFLLLYIGSVLKNSSKKNDGLLFSFSLSPFFTAVLYAVYFSLFLFFLWKGIKGIRAIFCSYIDDLQHEYIPPKIDLNQFNDPSQYTKFHYNRTYESFSFRVQEMSVVMGGFEDFFPDILLGISDPKCFDKECVTDLFMTQSYFGFYKYRCPTCYKKYKSKYDKATLKANLKKVIFAEHERKEDKLPF